MEERVVTIEFNATVAGTKLDVCGANIVLGVNEIPRIELMVPPTKAKNSTPLKPNVFKPTLSDFTELYSKLSKDAENLDQTGNIDITVLTDSTASGHKSDKLSLKEWVLTGVGLSSVSATSAPYLSVILHHPAFWLTKVGSIYETPKTNSENRIAEVASEGSSFLDIVEKVYEAYRGDAEVEFFESPHSDLARVYRSQLGIGEFDPKKYMVEKEDQKLFLENDLEGAKKSIAAAIGRMVCPMGDGSSTWDMIVRSSGYLLLDVVQNEQNNFTSKIGLVIEPSKPWRTDNIVTMPEDMCFWTEVPGMDMFKLAGVMARKLIIFNNRLTTWANSVGQRPVDDESICDVLYCPEPPKRADGRIMKTSAPVVMQQMAMENSVCGGNIVTGNVDADKQILSSFDEALSVYCKAVFEKTYGSMNSAKAQMALGFKDVNGKWILPGNTFEFMSNGKPIYYGYIRSVVHSLATKGGCSTMLTMSHVRPTLTVSKVPNGNENAAYGS